ncbi:MAG: type II secretion system protein GspG [Candidatus Scalindua sp.]|nr:type II secretion system protein GspG [Candidatus Scalindua sp.]MCR4345223.1 type II secretion system protein GspG [Candidatus Scalindua sp.]
MQHSILNRQASIDNNHLSIFNIQSKAGFTLLELLVVIVIMMFLAGITVPIVSSVQTNAKKGVTSAQISQLGIALKQFESDFGFFPPDSYTTSSHPIPLSIGSVNIPRDDDLINGSRCLVFFLGSKFTFNPGLSNEEIYGPYIEFKKSQLVPMRTVFNNTDPYSNISIDGVNGQPNVYEYKDPFGNHYSYDSSSPPTLNNIASFDIYSTGPDKTTSSSGDDADDINNW